MAAATSVHVVAIVEPIIQHADWFFPEGRSWASSTAAVFSLTFSPLFVANGPIVHEGRAVKATDISRLKRQKINSNKASSAQDKYHCGFPGSNCAFKVGLKARTEKHVT